jgi:hypothetical protein
MNAKDANGILCFNFDVSIIQAKADKVRSCQRCRVYFTRAFAMPKSWWAEYCRNSNGYFGCEYMTDEQENVTSFNTWTRFSVKHLQEDTTVDWYKFNVFTRWLSSSRQTIVLIFDAPSAIAKRLPNPLLDDLDTEQQFGDPFWIYPRLVEEVVSLQDQAVWAIRTHARTTEKFRLVTENRQGVYPHLHDLARHAIHVSETLELATKTMESILAQHTDFTTDIPDVDTKLKHESRHIHMRLLFYNHVFSSLRLRSVSNKERLLNEIQLASNMVAQHGTLLSAIGAAVAKDSAAMRTIASVTLAFLPATFVSTIFSMSFFNYSPDSGSWTVSDKFWVYWVVAIPITIISVVLWIVLGREVSS